MGTIEEPLKSDFYKELETVVALEESTALAYPWPTYPWAMSSENIMAHAKRIENECRGCTDGLYGAIEKICGINPELNK